MSTQALLAGGIGGLLLLAGAFPVFAHVAVKPNQANVGAFQTFVMGVPNEKDMPTTALRLVMPQGLMHVSPNVKPGWKIEVVKSGDGDDAMVTELRWTGGTVPAGMRDEFAFSAQVPAQENTLQWKAYQTYQGGTVIAWDQPRNESQKDFSVNGPYSETKVVNDLASSQSMSSHDEGDDKGERGNRKALVISMVAVVVAIISLGMQVRKK